MGTQKKTKNRGISPPTKLAVTALFSQKFRPTYELLRLGKDGNKFFSSPNGEPYVCLNYEQSSKAMKIKHKNFKGLLTKLFFEETDEASISDALNQALNQFQRHCQT